MKKTVKLAAVLFKSSLNIQDASSKKKQIVKLIFWIVCAICIAPLIFLLYNAGHFGYLLFEQKHESDALIAAVMFVISAGICITGIPACINSLYYSDNNNSLFVMPLKPTQIAGAKLIVATVYEYYLSFVLLAPFLIGYGVAAGKSIIFWVAVLIAVILMPIVPMAYAGIISVLFMRLFKGIKGKNKMPIIAAIAVFSSTLLISAFGNLHGSMSLKSMEALALHLAGVFKKLTMIFPDIPFISTALSNQHFVSGIMAIIFSALVLILYWALTKAFYFAAAVGRTEKSASKRTLDDSEMSKYTQSQSILKSYTKKELKTLMRDSSCFMQCFLITLGWPLILIATAMFSNQAGFEGELIHDLISSSVKNSPHFVAVLFAVVFGATLFAAALNAIAPTAISREGKGYMLIKQLPIPYKTQLIAKRNAAFVVTFLGSGAYILIGGIILIIINGFPWWGVLVGLLMNFFILVILLDIEMLIGLMRARLDWESESDIMGKNIVGVIVFFIGLAILGGLFLLFNTKLAHISISPILFGAVIIVVLIVLAFLCERILYSYGPKKMEALS